MSTYLLQISLGMCQSRTGKASLALREDLFRRGTASFPFQAILVSTTLQWEAVACSNALLSLSLV